MPFWYTKGQLYIHRHLLQTSYVQPMWQTVLSLWCYSYVSCVVYFAQDARLQINPLVTYVYLPL